MDIPFPNVKSLFMPKGLPRLPLPSIVRSSFFFLDSIVCMRVCMGVHVCPHRFRHMNEQYILNGGDQYCTSPFQARGTSL